MYPNIPKEKALKELKKGLPDLGLERKSGKVLFVNLFMYKPKFFRIQKPIL